MPKLLAVSLFLSKELLNFPIITVQGGLQEWWDQRESAQTKPSMGSQRGGHVNQHDKLL